ncbi:MAG: FAD:protein FMN transferase [Myxococcales bacterium]|nr:FAD:protein FMN transferase [Myxococcales bacterium]
MVHVLLAFFALALLPACTPESGARPADEAPAPAPPPKLYAEQRELMGTVFSIRVDAKGRVARAAVAEAFAEMERLEEILSEWRPTSEISRIAQAAGQHPVEISSDTMAVLRAGLEVSRESKGAFDLTWAVLHGLYDFRPGFARLPSRAEVRARLPLIDYRDLVLDEAASTAFLKRKGMALGTGGIGKGYALDKAGAILERHGITSYILFGGGQVQVKGMRGDRPWRVGIQHPRRPNEYIAYFEATEGSVSTSGDYERYLVGPSGERIHHILDVRTGLPAHRSISATVLAPSGLYADALSTAAFVMGPERALAMFDRLPFPVKAVLIDPDCQVFTTPGTLEELHLQVELQSGVLPGCD